MIFFISDFRSFGGSCFVEFCRSCLVADWNSNQSFYILSSLLLL